MIPFFPSKDSQHRGPLSPQQRHEGQQAALFSNLFISTVMYIIVGAMMQLYANDVLKLSPMRISSILALLPLFGILRLPLLPFIRRFGKVRSLLASNMIRLGVTIILLILPARTMTFGVYLFLLIIYDFCTQLGLGTVWQPLLRDVTTNDDRGEFFSRMRLCFTLVNGVIAAVIAVMVGDQIGELEYKILLLLAAGMIAWRIYFERHIPEQMSQEDSNPHMPRVSGFKRLVSVWRQSPLLRIPLIIFLLIPLSTIPVYFVYLRQALDIPSNIITLHTLFGMFGAMLSLFFWGRMSDTLGFRVVSSGTLWIIVLAAPLQLFILPMTSEAANFSSFGATEWITTITLCLTGTIGGIAGAGLGIGLISIQHFYSSSEESLEAMNYLGILLALTVGATTAFSGFYLENIVLPGTSFTLADGIMHFDWMKGWLLIPVPLMQLGAIYLVYKLPNAQTSFGIMNFVTTLAANPLVSLFRQRHVYHQSEKHRTELARWLGHRPNAMAIQPLLSLLDDPSHDVKLEAIHGLSRSGSDKAGERLLQVFQDEEAAHLTDHVAWALGELNYTPAREALCQCLRTSTDSRARAMSARALGKIGGDGIPQALVNTLKIPDLSLNVVAACCRALLRLNDKNSLELILTNLHRLYQREERYEIMDILCTMMDIPNEWLLRSNKHHSPRESLVNDVQRRSYSWKKKHRETIHALQHRDINALQELIRKELKKRKNAPSPMIRALIDNLLTLDDWGPVAVLATAWLLYTK